MDILDSANWSAALLGGIVEFTVRATVLLVIALAAVRAMRSRSAAARHLVWTGTVAGVLLLPFLSATLPEWRVAILPAPSQVSAAMPAHEVVALEAPTPVAPENARMTPRSSNDVPMPAVSSARTDVVAAAIAWSRALDVGTTASIVWLAIAALLLVRLAIANARVSSWQRASVEVDDVPLLTLARRLCRMHGIARPVVLLQSDETDVPVTWGIVYPVILLPTVALAWDEEQRVAVLTHELAHVKRLDALTQQIGQVAMALLWFHPLLWHALRRMRVEREHACDDFVLAAGARPSRYADDLLGLARGLTRPMAPAAAALAMARRTELEGRLLAILDPRQRRGSVRRARVALLAVGLTAFIIPLAAFRPAPRSIVRASATPPVNGWSAPASAATMPVPSTRAHAADPMTPLAPRPESPTLPAPVLPQARTTRDLLDDALLLRVRADTDPVPIDLQTLIEVTRATQRMTSDAEKGQLLALIARRYQRSAELRDAYIASASTMTSDDERTKALVALLARDSLPLDAVTRVLEATAAMTSDVSKGEVLKLISPATYADTAVQRAYLSAIVAMTSDTERGAAIANLLRQRNLTAPMQLALLDAITPMTSDVEKANALMLFLDHQGVANERVRRKFFTAAETITSDVDYRRVMTAVMK